MGEAAIPGESSKLTVRCVLGLLGAMGAALAAGLLAWGPIGPAAHVYAGTAGRADALASLSLVLAAAIGLAALRRSRWPPEVVRPWRGFFAATGMASLLARLFHLLPVDTGHLVVHLLMAAAFTLLLTGFLAERVHPEFGTRSACVIALLLPLLAALWSVVSDASRGTVDLRGLLLLQMLPVLLLPAGALGLAGRLTRAGDWLAMLLLYALARLLELADAEIRAATGWISGHALMHLLLAAVVLWLGYRARTSAVAGATAGASARGASRQRISSANTSA